MAYLWGHTVLENAGEDALGEMARTMQSRASHPCMHQLLYAAPMARRNDAYTTIYFYRYR